MRGNDRHSGCIALIAAALASLVLGGPVSAQPTAPQAPNPQMVAAQAAFEALPEAERKAIQTDLIWAGYFNGAVSGTFGPLTFRAINALKAAGKGAPDGVVTPADRRVLAGAARQGRDAVGFRVAADERSGVVIGIPAKVLPKRDVNASGGSRWQSEDGKVTLDTSAAPAGEPLEALFEKATSAAVVGRKITYKLLRPDFFVVTGETASGRFYRRLALGPAGLRGFSIGYDKAQAGSVDKLVIAIANSFEPFPSARPPVAPPSATATTTVPAIAVPVLRPTERFGGGVAVSERLVLTATVAIDPCRSLRVAGRAAKLRSKDDASGLALLEVEGPALTSSPGLRNQDFAAQEAVVLMAYGETGSGRGAMALPGTMLTGGSGPLVLAPLQPGQAGSPVYDRQGALAGLVTANPSDKVLVAGIAPQRSYAAGSVASLRAVLDRAGVSLPAPAALSNPSTGAVVERTTKSVLAVACGL